MNYFAMQRHFDKKNWQPETPDPRPHIKSGFVTYDDFGGKLHFWPSETEAREWVQEFGGVYAAIPV